MVSRLHDASKIQHYASVSSKRQLPPGQSPGEFLKVVKSLAAPGQNFSAKARPPGQKSTYPGNISEDPVSLSY